MGNILHYLKWRGDLTFEERSFNEADNLALALLSYTDFSGIIPGLGSEEWISMKDAAFRFSQEDGQRNLSKHGTETVFYAMALSRRFCQAKLFHYINETDERTGMHFCAVSILLDDGTEYISYRGTGGKIDDWREDFRISFEQTPAQAQAVEYLNQALEMPASGYIIGGHSKGGNLALYAAIHCRDDLRAKIKAVYSNDGPGICPDFLDWSAFEEIRTRYHHIVPEYSVVGMLFHNEALSTVIKSSAAGIMQHDGMTWQVSGDGLKRGKQLETESQNYNMIFDRWIESADMAQREQFTAEFFDALKTGGATEMEEIAGGGLDGFGTILVSIAESESKTKLVILKFLMSVAEQIRQVSFRETAKKRGTVIGVLLALLGTFFIMLPEDSYKVFGGMLALSLFVWAGQNIIKYAMREMEPRKKRSRLMLYMLIMSLMVLLLASMNRFTFLTNAMVAVTFLLIGFRLFREAFCNQNRKAARIISTLFALLALAVGLASLATPNSIGYEKALSSGSFLLLAGVGMILYEIIRSGRKKQRLVIDEEESILSELREDWRQEQEKCWEERKYDPYISG